MEKNAWNCNNLFDIAGKVVVITGAGGLGCGLAEGFAQNGATVVVANRTVEKAQAVVNQITTAGGKALALPMDLLDKTSIEKLVADVTAAFGQIDVLIHTAILWEPMDAREDHDDLLSRQMEANIVGTTQLLRQVANSMVEKKVAGSIININSVSGRTTSTWKGYPYGVAKAAMTRMTNYFAMLYARKGIRVNEIAPIWIETPMMGNYSAAYKQAFVDQVPMHDVTRPEDYLALCIFLSTAGNRMVSGQTITVDGGWSGCRIHEWPENMWPED